MEGLSPESFFCEESSEIFKRATILITRVEQRGGQIDLRTTEIYNDEAAIFYNDREEKLPFQCIVDSNLKDLDFGFGIGLDKNGGLYLKNGLAEISCMDFGNGIVEVMGYESKGDLPKGVKSMYYIGYYGRNTYDVMEAMGSAESDIVTYGLLSYKNNTDRLM